MVKREKLVKTDTGARIFCSCKLQAEAARFFPASFPGFCAGILETNGRIALAFYAEDLAPLKDAKNERIALMKPLNKARLKGRESPPVFKGGFLGEAGRWI